VLQQRVLERAGFEHPPVFLTGHGKPYYDARVQAEGYHKAKDVVAYSLDFTASPPRTMVEAARRAREAARVKIRPLDKSRIAAETATISEVFCDAWEHNWSFVPFTQAEFLEFARDYLGVDIIFWSTTSPWLRGPT